MQGYQGKAGPALSSLNLCLTPPGQKVQVVLLSLRRDGQTCALEARSFRGAGKVQKGKNKPPECFAAVFLSILITVL